MVQFGDAPGEECPVCRTIVGEAEAERDALRAELKARGFYWKWNPETGQATCYKIKYDLVDDLRDDPALD